MVAGPDCAARAVRPNSSDLGSGARFVYVIDCSGSMIGHNAMQSAKNELLSSLRTLNRSQQFQIIFYNMRQKWMKAPGNVNLQYFSATGVNRRLAEQFVTEIQPDDGTMHLPALRLALRLHPDVIYFLTDAGEEGQWLSAGDLEEVRRLNNGHSPASIAFSSAPKSRPAPRPKTSCKSWPTRTGETTSAAT